MIIILSEDYTDLLLQETSSVSPEKLIFFRNGLYFEYNIQKVTFTYNQENNFMFLLNTMSQITWRVNLDWLLIYLNLTYLLAHEP